MTRIRRVQTDDRDINQLQNNIAEVLEPVASLSTNQGVFVTSIVLAVGDNTINHGLNRNLIGWMTSRVRAATTLFDKQDTNPQQNLTLILNSSAVATIDLYVF